MYDGDIMKVVLIVVNYNDFITTSDFVEKIRNYKIIDEIIIVDNNSTDDSYEKLKKFNDDHISVLKNNVNGGYGCGNNFGIKYAIKKYKECNIIISNPDIIVTEQTIKTLLKDLNSDSKIAIVGPIINTFGKKENGWKLSGGFTELLLSIPIFGRTKRNTIIGYKKSHFNSKLTDVDVVSGCFFVTKSKCFEEINYFDENVFLYYEENIVASKLKKLEYKTILDTRCEVIHNHSVSIDKSHSLKNKYKILKQSQMYYLNNYTKASNLSKKVIKIISKIMLKYYK